MESLTLSFLGAAGTVTGSKTLLEDNELKVLVDCGLFQGLKVLRLLNWEPLPVDASKITALIITHAHLDHVGYIPLLVKNGFRGPIYATPPTCDLAKIILRDSAKIQEEEAWLANKGKYSSHDPAEPLYTIKNAEQALTYFVPIDDRSWFPISDNFKFRFQKNGHILGSAFVEIVAHNKKIVFSGDLGRSDSLLLEPPVQIDEADVLVLESTYGDREHPVNPSDLELSGIVNDALWKHGNLIIPTFAVERAQEILFILNSLKAKNMIPKHIPIYLDSPMGIDATEVMIKYPAWHKFDEDFCKMISNDIILIRDFNDTLDVVKDPHLKIIIAGSGMLSGGRVLEYLKAYIGNKNTTVLFVGYQAEGTRGKALLRGADRIKIHGDQYSVQAEIKEVSSFSGHADRSEILNWFSAFSKKPSRIFLNHGELKSSEALRVAFKEKFGIECEVPLLNSRFVLS